MNRLHWRRKNGSIIKNTYARIYCYVGSRWYEKPLYFFCEKVLGNRSKKPVKLKEHLNANHLGNISDSSNAFLQNKARFEVTGTLDKYEFIPTEKPLLVTSYKIAYCIAEEKKLHSIAETLIQPCALEMNEIVCGSDQKRNFEGMSNNVVRSRIDDISENNVKQAMGKLATSFSI